LDDSCGYSNIIEEAKPHVIVRLSVMTRRADDREALLKLTTRNSKTGFYNAPAT
jgi:hypothetical protein